MAQLDVIIPLVRHGDVTSLDFNRMLGLGEIDVAKAPQALIADIAAEVELRDWLTAVRRSRKRSRSGQSEGEEQPALSTPPARAAEAGKAFNAFTSFTWDRKADDIDFTPLTEITNARFNFSKRQRENEIGCTPQRNMQWQSVLLRHAGQQIRVDAA